MKEMLALRIKLGDEQAFELLFRKLYVRLCGYANKYFNDPDEARDVVQEAFLKLWEGRDDIDPEGSLTAYLFKITHNLCINRLRHKQVESNYSGIYKLVYAEYKSIDPHESLIANELNDDISKAYNSIPVKCRRIFELSRLEGLKYSEIAETLGISVKTVEAQISKALQILRLGLKDYLR